MGLPYDAERVGQLRNMLREARKRKFVSRAGGETRTAPTLSSALAAFNRRRFMIIRGIAATPGTPIEGMTLLGGAFDCNSDVPLLHRHGRAIGRVLTLSYRGDDLHVLVETNDDVGRKANYFSPGFRVLEHRNSKVTRARLEEISLTGDPVNLACQGSRENPRRTISRAPSALRGNETT
jgi:hypothetical protein